MRKTLLLTAVLSLLGGVSAAQVVSSSPPVRIVSNQPVEGRFAFVSGEVWTAANVFEKENIERSTPLARFNLAASYAATARPRAAIELYRSAARDGAFTTTILDTINGSSRRSSRVNVAAEATRRADALELVSGAVETAAIGDVSEVLTSEAPESLTAAIVAREHLSDEIAMSRDRVVFGQN